MNVLVAGDFCPYDRVAKLIDDNKYEQIFKEVVPITKSVDYSIVNFECAVINNNAKPIVKYGPNLGCSSKAVDAIKYAGFDCVTLSNNHFYDYGEIGVDETLKYLNKNNIDYCGGGKCLKEASKVLYKDLNGERLAIINCCEHEFSIATETTGGSNPLDTIQQYYAIQEAKKNADYVLVIVHGGHEHFQLPSIRMQDTYRFFVDAGADAVINHHQHCYSGYEMYKNKPICYGLGNFCFDWPNERNCIWNEGYMVKLEFSKIGINLRRIDYKQSDEVPKVTLINNSIYENRIEFLNNCICNRNLLINEVEKYYDGRKIGYLISLDPIRNRYLSAMQRRHLFPRLRTKRKLLENENFINCESHVDILRYALQKLRVLK